MPNRVKNTATIKLLIRQLTDNRSCDPDGVRLQCKTVVYACFLMGIEPFQLPISDSFAGNLSESQKRDFLHRYLSLQMDSTNRNRVASQLVNGEPTWSSLVHLVDEIICTENT